MEAMAICGGAWAPKSTDRCECIGPIRFAEVRDGFLADGHLLTAGQKAVDVCQGRPSAITKQSKSDIS